MPVRIRVEILDDLGEMRPLPEVVRNRYPIGIFFLF